MKIAVQASDLDHSRIDGTRVYLMELLRRFGSIAREDTFNLYHAASFNTLLAPPKLPNYSEKQVAFPYAWMQTRFAWELYKDHPDKLFLPIQAAPFVMPNKIDVTATIHDLAWKKYPETFSPKIRFKLDLLLRRVAMRANKLIAVSNSTKNDLIKYFPERDPESIAVIHHGFNAELFRERIATEELTQFLEPHRLRRRNYVLYVGALQPRKNLVRLIEAFEIAKRHHPDMELVLVGERAWLAANIVKHAEESMYARDIHLIGAVTFEELRYWYQGARLFAFPSLYEGFGMPILEAFASGVPVLTASNSSLPEVAGNAALYVDAEDAEDIAEKLTELWSNEDLQNDLKTKGSTRLSQFSWDICAQETIRYILA